MIRSWSTHGMQLLRNIKYVLYLSRCLIVIVINEFLQYYHSLHARGEKVEDVLRQVDEANAQHEATDADALRVFDTAGVASHAERDIEDGEMSVDHACVMVPC